MSEAEFAQLLVLLGEDEAIHDVWVDRFIEHVRAFDRRGLSVIFRALITASKPWTLDNFNRQLARKKSFQDVLANAGNYITPPVHDDAGKQILSLMLKYAHDNIQKMDGWVDEPMTNIKREWVKRQMKLVVFQIDFVRKVLDDVHESNHGEG